MLTNEEPPAHITAGPYQDEFQPIVPSSLRDDSLHVNEFKPLPASLSPSLATSLAPPKRQKLTPDIRSDDFSAFKPLPLPDDVPIPAGSDLEELLKSYGLLDGDTSRNSKSMAGEMRDGDDAITTTTTTTKKPEKIPKMMNVPEVNVEFLSPDLMQVLGDMGVKAEPKPKAKATTTARPRTTQNFPFTSEATGASATTPNDYEKLHLLLDTIKQLDSLNANLTAEELDSLNLRHFNFSDELLAQGPDPIDDYYSYDVRKNEIKRRQSNVEDEDTDDKTTSDEPFKLSLDLAGVISTTTASSKSDDDDAGVTTTTAESSDTAETTTVTAQNQARSMEKAVDADETSTTADEDDDEAKTTTAPETTTTTSTTTTEESRNGSLKDLADSFGGDSDSDTGLDPVSDEALPAPKRNGFYFFSDWNSFLEVGEDPEKVVVRFDPKVGDSRPFIPVKIP